jgi:hypothetical protein
MAIALIAQGGSTNRPCEFSQTFRVTSERILRTTSGETPRWICIRRRTLEVVDGVPVAVKDCSSREKENRLWTVRRIEVEPHSVTASDPVYDTVTSI